MMISCMMPPCAICKRSVKPRSDCPSPSSSNIHPLEGDRRVPEYPGAQLSRRYRPENDIDRPAKKSASVERCGAGHAHRRSRRVNNPDSCSEMPAMTFSMKRQAQDCGAICNAWVACKVQLARSLPAPICATTPQYRRRSGQRPVHGRPAAAHPERGWTARRQTAVSG